MRASPVAYRCVGMNLRPMAGTGAATPTAAANGRTVACATSGPTTARMTSGRRTASTTTDRLPAIRLAGGRIVHGARSDDDEQAVVGPVEDADGVGATRTHGRGGDLVGGVLGAHDGRRHEGADPHGALLVEIRGRDAVDLGAHWVRFPVLRPTHEKMRFQRAGPLSGS